MKGNEANGSRGPVRFKGPRGPRPLMSLRPDQLRMTSLNGFRPRFGPRIPFPRQGPRDFGPPRPMMQNPTAPGLMPPRLPRGCQRPPQPAPLPRSLFPPNVPLMRHPIQPPINAPRHRRPPPLMSTQPHPRPASKRSKPQNRNNVQRPKKVAVADIDFTVDSFDIQSNKLGTAF